MNAPSPTPPIRYEDARLTRRTAQAGEIDELGHVNNAVYVSWVQDAATDHWYACVPEALAQRFIWVCLRHEIDYREPVLEGETVEIRTWLGACRGARFDRYVDIRKPGSRKGSIKAKTTWVLLDQASRKPMRVTDEILSAFGLDRGMVEAME